MITPLPIRAGFWRRTAALALDLCISVAPAFVLAVVVDTALAVAGRRSALSNYLLSIALWMVVLAYTSLEIFKAATPGKMIFGLAIATPGGLPADRWTLALRWSTKQAPLLMGLIHSVTLDLLSGFLASIMTYVVVLGCLQALDERKRIWHDEWSGTAVFRRSRELHGRAPGPTIP